MIAFNPSQVDDELAAHIDAARKALVQVRAGRHGTGSGTVVHGDGLIISNAHVVRRHAPRVVLHSGEELPARLLAYNEQLDLAALSIDVSLLDGGQFVALPLADGRRLTAGSLVVALGHPWGVVGAATAGMVIGVGRPLEPLPYHGELIQVGLQLRPGHSGGPMLNAEGDLVGINTMIAGPHVGFAIPANTVRRFLKENLGTKRRRRVPRAPQRVPA